MHTGTRPVWLSITALACVLAAIRLGVVIFAPYDRVVGMFDDDAFYYFGVAQHIAAGDGSTFNGLDPTNGYHPLWLLLLVPLYAVTEGHFALIAVTFVSATLFVSSARLLDRIGERVGRPVLVTFCAIPLLVVGTAGPSFWFSGMETGLLLFSLLWLASTYLRSDGFTAPGFTAGHARVVGVLMALAILSRLDAVFPMVLLAVLALVTWRRARGCRGCASAAGSSRGPRSCLSVTWWLTRCCSIPRCRFPGRPRRLVLLGSTWMSLASFSPRRCCSASRRCSV